MKSRTIQWGAIGIAALLIVVMAPSDNDDRNTKMGRAENRPSSDTTNSGRQGVHEAGHVELYRLAKLELLHKEKRKVGDAFNTGAWDTPPPPVRPVQPVEQTPPPVVVVAPAAPPLPFTYLGRYGDASSRVIILSKGDKVYTVSVGDVIENTYRVEQLTAGMVNLIYLPLSIEQHLLTGEAL